MSKPLRVLQVEDSPDDADLILLELRRYGFKAVSERVDTPDALARVLADREWDIVLSDHVMPQFSSERALALLKESKSDVPFVLVSGKIGEEAAVNIMRAGARDYVPKDQLTRLGPVIDRELEEAQRHRDLKRAQEARSQLAAIVESSSDAIIGTDLTGHIISWNPGAEKVFGYTPAEVLGLPLAVLLPQETTNTPDQVISRIREGRHVEHYETTRARKDGKMIYVSLTLSPIRDHSGKTVGVSTIARDISERKEAELERERLIRELRDALATIKSLRGMLPICASCKRIRDDKGYWNQIELYIAEHSEAQFTHGICPECVRKYYPELGAGGPPA